MQDLPILIPSTGQEHGLLYTRRMMLPLFPRQSSKIAVIKTGDSLGEKDTMPIQTVGKKIDNFYQKPDFAQAVAELENYRLTTSQQKLSSLTAQISEARQAYAQANTKLLQLKAVNPETVYNDTFILNLSDEDWGKTETGIQQSAERILAQGIPPGLPPKRPNGR